MINICIIESYANKVMHLKTNMDAHLRNSLAIKDYLNKDENIKCDILLVENDFKRCLNKKYDVLMLSYASFYAPFNFIKKVIENNEKSDKFWITNEYNLLPVGSIRAYDHTIIANYDQKYRPYSKGVKNFIQLNLNLILSKYQNQIGNNTKKYDCIYYGTFRTGRKKYFKKYLQKGIYLSTSGKNFKKFKHVGCDPIYVKKLSWTDKKETLNTFRYSLYIEDEFTHDVFNHLGNRWYESGFCNNVVFFDVNCWNTILNSELTGNKKSPAHNEDLIKYYLVSSYTELIHKIKECNKDFGKHLAIQKAWRLSEPVLRENLFKDIKLILTEKTLQNGHL